VWKKNWTPTDGNKYLDKSRTVCQNMSKLHEI
jgi:hypothetical protein